MANIIAVVWDFDKTLIKGYMEDPILEDNGIEPAAFWKEVNSLPEKYHREQNIRVNPETIYLNHMIKYAREGKIKDLNNTALREYGKKVEFFDGVPEIFTLTKSLIEDKDIYKEHDIKVEHYIVSTGIAEVIRGSKVGEIVDGIWGCEFIETPDADGNMIIGEVGYTIDNTTKTRALFEINKGVNRDSSINVNASIPEEYRRVHFINMVYVADGPSDIPAFSVVNKNGGATFAVYPTGDLKAMEQVERLRENQRINMFAEADYSEGRTASMWLCNKIREFADKIREEERKKIEEYAEKGVAKHLV